MGDPSQYLPDLVLYQILLEDRQSPQPVVRLDCVELYSPVREDRRGLSMLPDRLLEHLQRVLRCRLWEQAVSDDETRRVVFVRDEPSHTLNKGPVGMPQR